MGWAMVERGVSKKTAEEESLDWCYDATEIWSDHGYSRQFRYIVHINHDHVYNYTDTCSSHIVTAVQSSHDNRMDNVTKGALSVNY